MFGILRFLLAYLVVLSHLVGTEYFVHFGFYAVRGFFVVSGYLMTAALNEVYGFDGLRFWANRALRLLPPFYLVGAITLAAITLAPDAAGHFQKAWVPEPNARDLWLNFAVLPLQFKNPLFRMLPQFWSIALELQMYFLLYLIVARRLSFALVALAIGFYYHLAVSTAGGDSPSLYFFAPSALMPFAAGAVVYFLRRRESYVLPLPVVAVVFVVWLANMTAGGSLFPKSYIFGIGYYLDTVLVTILTAGLAERSFSPRLDRVDRTLGEWAYFVFLVQWLAGFAVASLVLSGEWRGWVLVLAATPVIFASGAGLAVVNRWLLDPFRDRVRGLRVEGIGAQWRKLLLVLGVDPIAALAAEPALAPALQQSCALCADRTRCRADLAAGAARANFRTYCPNTATFDRLAAAR